MALLRTKMHMPLGEKNYFHRQHLYDRLDRSLQRPFTLVSAPAGYGKSSLLANWLKTSETPNGWISLDEDDNDLRQFLSYLTTVVQGLFPGAVQGTKSLLSSPQLPPLKILSDTLINELDGVDQSLIIVLDDYHVIREKNIHTIILNLLQHPPVPFHLVLSSRFDPPFPLARFRARSQMDEIRARELRFSLREARDFLKQLANIPIDNFLLNELAEKTEGWVTGLRLAVLSIKDSPDPGLIAENLPNESLYTTEYLLSEVLTKQPEEIQNYLLETSVLDRFCAPLCDAICIPHFRCQENKIEGSQFIDWLSKSDLFVISLDNQKLWFRYHHLFQQLLKKRLYEKLSEQEISNINLRASNWFSENSLIEEAIRHALAAEDLSKAAQLVEDNRHTPLNEEKWYVLDRWLSLLPDEVKEKRPNLLISKAWIMRYKFKLWSLPTLLKDIQTLTGSEIEGPLKEEINLFQGMLFFWEGNGTQSLELFRRVIDRTPPQYIGVRRDAETYFGIASQLTGHGKEIKKIYQMKLSNEASEGPHKVRLLANLVFIHLLSGELAEAKEVAKQMHDIATRTPNLFTIAYASYLQGLIHFQWNQLEQAVHFFSNALNKEIVLSAFADIDSYAGLIFSYQGMQQAEKAKEVMSALLEYSYKANNPAYLPRARSIQARLSLEQGDLASAKRWLDTADTSNMKGMMVFWLEVPRLTLCRVLIAMETESSLRQAEEKLKTHWRFAKSTFNIPQMIEISLLQAVTYQKQQLKAKVHSCLEKAVTLARPGQYIRPFINLDLSLIKLLKSFPLDVFTQRLLQTIDENSSLIEHKISSIKNMQPQWVSNKALKNPLTPRELEILPYLAQGLRNKEIADKLFISHETVKKHVLHINKKLDSRNRQEAVVKAYQHGVI